MAATESRGVLAALSDELADAVAQGGASVVTVDARRRLGASGVIWPSGVVVTADHVLEGVREAMAKGGTRAGHVEVVLDEMDATRRALDRSRPGDLVVLCVDYATEVFKELEARRSLAAPNVFATSEGNGHVEHAGGDPDLLGV